MELGLIGVYNKAVHAVPSIRYAMGVAGVIAAALIAFNLSNSDPKKAVLAFIFVLAGMYLLLVFASIKDLTETMKWPVTIIVWALTIMFVSSLALTLSAFAIGKPEGWAKLVGALPAVAREITSELVSATEAPPKAGELALKPVEVAPVPAETPPIPSQKVAVQEIFQFSDGSNDCGTNTVKSVEFCMSSGAKIVNWSGPNVSSANCGSQFTNIRPIPGRENCIAVDAVIRGCGYDNFPFGIQNCRGRGWLVGSFGLNGEK